MKKYGFAAAIAAGTLIGCSSAPQPTTEPAAPKAETVVEATVKKDTLISKTDRYSYALGVNLGQSLKDVFELGLDMNVINQGVQSQIDTAAKPLMTNEEVEATLQALVLEMQLKREAKAAEDAAKFIAEQKAFLENNKTAEGVITTASGLQYKILQDANGITPTKNDKVKVHYKGTLLDGKQFDSSYDRGEPLEFPVSAVIEGWQELLTNLKSGMKAIAWIPSELGYGEAGAPPIIPGNSMLIFEVELLEVIQANPTPADTLAPAAEAKADSAKPVETVPATEQAATATAPAAEPVKTEVKPETKAEPKADVKAETKAEEKSAPKAEAKKEEAKPATPTKSDSKPTEKK